MRRGKGLGFTSSIREWMRPLADTPLHPQWLIFLGREQTRTWIQQHVSGRVLDIGCGDRWVESQLRRDYLYVGLDYPKTANL